MIIPNQILVCRVGINEGYPTLQNHKEYCDHKGYGFVSILAERDFATIKFDTFKEYVESLWESQYQYFVFIDEDCVIMNYSISIENIISENNRGPETFLWIGQYPTYINSEVFIVRKCEQTKKFMHEVSSYPEEIGTYFSMNMVLGDIASNSKWVKLHNRVLNSLYCPPEECNIPDYKHLKDCMYKDGDFIINVKDYYPDQKYYVIGELCESKK